MKLMYKLSKEGIWIAYFEGQERFHGTGRTKMEALADLKDKLTRVIEAIGRIQRNGEHGE